MKSLLLLFCFLMLLLHIESYNIVCAISLVFLLCWICKDAVCEYFSSVFYSGFNGQTSFGYDYEYYGESGKTNKDYYPNYTLHKATINEVKLNIAKTLKPSLLVIPKNKENESSVRAKKEMYIEKMASFTEKDVCQPTTQTTTTESNVVEENKQNNATINDVIILTNSNDISKFKKELYSNSISFFTSNKKYSDIVFDFVQTVKFVDVVEETMSIVFYLSDVNFFENNNITKDEFINYLKSKNGSIKSIDIDEFKHISLTDFYKKQ